MATVSGTGTTYTLPNYHGELFTVAKTETPFLAAIGGINGAKTVHSKTWEWQTESRRTSTANNAALEGQAAPTATNQSRGNVSNITEIHHSKVSVSYSKQAATGQFSGENIASEWDDIVIDELTHQVSVELESMAVDINMSFLSGTKVTPANNATARATQGILGALATNVSANGGTNRALTPVIVNSLLKTMRATGRLSPEHTVFLVGSDQLLNLTSVYAAQSTLSAPVRDRNIAGMAINTIVTPFGTFGVLEDPWMPARQIAITRLDVCYPVFTEIPGKGILFTEPLAKTGATDDFQLYTEIGLEYGPEQYHGLIKDLLNSDGT
jgi:hypothetical protein